MRLDGFVMKCVPSRSSQHTECWQHTNTTIFLLLVSLSRACSVWRRLDERKLINLVNIELRAVVVVSGTSQYDTNAS